MLVNKTVRLLHSYRDAQNMHDSYLNRLLQRNIYKYKSSHLYLYSSFNNTNCVKATTLYQNSVSLM